MFSFPEVGCSTLLGSASPRYALRLIPTVRILHHPGNGLFIKITATGIKTG
jgi:hypothetical protein